MKEAHANKKDILGLKYVWSATEDDNKLKCMTIKVHDTLCIEAFALFTI